MDDRMCCNTYINDPLLCHQSTQSCRQYQFLPDDYVCPYIQQKCNFHDLTIAELEEAYEIFDAIPEETRNRLIDEIFKKNKD